MGLLGVTAESSVGFSASLGCCGGTASELYGTCVSSLRPGLCCPSMVSTGLRANYVRLLRSCCWFRIGGFWALRSSCAKSPCLRQALRIKITPLPRLRHFRCIREIIEDSSDLSPSATSSYRSTRAIGEHDVSVSADVPARTILLSKPTDWAVGISFSPDLLPPPPLPSPPLFQSRGGQSANPSLLPHRQAACSELFCL